MITDGEIIITDMSSEVAAMLWRELYLGQSKDGLSPEEKSLYAALTAELEARVADTAARRPKKEAS